MMACYFYPRSPCGERPYGRINDISRLIFLSTLSLRRATGRLAGYDAGNQNFYPRSPCGERQLERRYLRLCSDYFYPRSPCGERPVFGGTWIWKSKFLSTLSLRRATQPWGPRPQPPRHFYPRSPCGERRDQTILKVYGYGISIHALLAESDSVLLNTQKRHIQFLSTLSLRRATSCAIYY